MEISMVDIKFIAKMSGTSPATVSRVLNNTKPVSPQLRERVLKNVEKYGYHPNLAAQQMVSKRTGLIGVLLTDISNPYQANYLACIEQALDKKYSVFVSSTYGDTTQFGRCMAVLRERCVDAIVIMFPLNQDVKGIVQKYTDIPIVYPNMRLVNTAGEMVHITVDDYMAAYRETEYLISMGHRSLGYFGSYGQRAKGFLAAAKARGIPLEDITLVLDPSECPPLDKALAAASRKDAPTAWFCRADMLAMRFMLALMQQGIRVPEDVSLVGFDDIGYASQIGLTTTRQPNRLKAERIVALITQMLSGQAIQGLSQEIPSELIIRTSVRRLP